MYMDECIMLILEVSNLVYVGFKMEDRYGFFGYFKFILKL